MNKFRCETPPISDKVSDIVNDNAPDGTFVRLTVVDRGRRGIVDSSKRMMLQRNVQHLCQTRVLSQGPTSPPILQTDRRQR